MKRTCKRWVATVLSLLMLGAMLPLAAVGVSGETVPYASIEVGDVLTVSLTAEQPEQYLHFVPETDGGYRFYSMGAVDTCGVLLDDQGNERIGDDDSGEELNFDFNTYLHAGQEYYLNVFMYSSGTGSFQVAVETYDAGIVPDAVLSLGEHITATNIPVDEASYFLFTPDASGWYTFYTTGATDTYGSLLDFSGNLLISNDNTIDEDNFSLTYFLEGNVPYYVVVWGYGGWTVNYDLYVEARTIYQLFPTAEIIGDGANYTCTTATDGDHLYFRFMPEVSGEYRFYSGGEADPYCFFYDAYEGFVGRTDDRGEEDYNFDFTYDYVAGRPYYFMIGDWSSTTSFTIDLVWVEPEEPEAEPITIAPGESVEVTAATTEEYQAFAFTPETDGWYCFTSSGDCDTNISFDHLSNSNDGEGQNFRAVTYCEAGETVYFYTWLQSEGAGTYTVSVNPIAEDALFPGARPIRSGDTLTVQQDAQSGTVIYRFVPTVSGFYTFFSHGPEDTYCYLYDVDGQYVVLEDDYYYEDFNFVLTREFEAGATYYFQVSAYQNEAGSAEYQVTLQEGELDALRAEQIFLDEIKTVKPVGYEDEQYYAFVPEESGWYCYSADGNGDLAASLRDEFGEYLAEESSGADGTVDLIFYCEKDQVYYIRIDSYSEELEEYTVTVSAAQEDALFPEAVAIHSGDTKTSVGEQYYRFVPTVSGVYSFTSSSEGDPVCTLYDVAQGEILQYDDIDYENGNLQFGFNYVFKAGQVYYLRVSQYDDEASDIAVTLLPESDVAMVEGVTVENLRAPEAGEHIYEYCDDVLALDLVPNMTVADAAVICNGQIVNADETFVDGQTYTVGFWIDAQANNAVFASDCVVQVNAGTNIQCEVASDSIVVYVDFTVGAVPAAIPGDANGDGAVNNRDVAMVQQYINKWDVSIDLDACDVNDDGAVNNRDLALMQQYINKWDVELK